MRGTFASITSLGATGTGVTGIFGILLCLNNPVGYILMFVIAFGVAFVLTWMFGYKDEVHETAEKNIEAEKKSDAPAEIAREKTSETGAQILYSPLEGIAIPLSEVKDATFASEVLGKGMAVIPSKGEVKAPCDATVSTIFDTKHAIGLATESGLELLIHIGVDTVELGSGKARRVGKRQVWLDPRAARRCCSRSRRPGPRCGRTARRR